MKSIIVYYSMSGNCELVSEDISQRIGADILRIYPEEAYPDKGVRKFLWGGKAAVMGDTPKLKPYTFNADEYDRVIFGFPVWAASPAPPIKSFIKENGDKLRGKRFAVFTCMSGSGGEKAIEKLKAMLSVEELEAQVILIDPKSREQAENENRIAEFCVCLP